MKLLRWTEVWLELSGLPFTCGEMTRHMVEMKCDSDIRTYEDNFLLFKSQMFWG